MGPLLNEYQQLRPLALARAAADVGALQAAPFLWGKAALDAESMGRYSHFRAQDLRVGDIPGLQFDFIHLSASSANL